jgi:hypothetical protein
VAVVLEEVALAAADTAAASVGADTAAADTTSPTAQRAAR